MSVATKKLIPKEERSNYVPGKVEPKTKIPEAIREEVLKRDNYTCQVCGSKENIKLVHRVPCCRGGPYGVSWNLVCLCSQCCNAKKNRTPEEFIKTYYVRYEVLGIGGRLPPDPTQVRVVFLDGTHLDGQVPEEPSWLRENFDMWVDGARVIIPREQIKAVVALPKGLEKKLELSRYLEKISS